MQATPTVSPFQTTSQSSIAAGASSKADEGNSALNAVDFQNFLTLLTAQLRNQDPLDPADSTEFVAQLAQFTSVEQLVNVNNKLDSLASAMVADGIDKYSSWIGKNAEAKSAPAYVDGSSPVRYRLSGLSDASRVETVITSKSGTEITRFQSLNGPTVQSWDGKVNGVAVPQGSYAVTALYYNRDNEVIGEEIANTFGTVREVRLDGAEPSIVLEGGVTVEPEQITGLGLAN